MRFILKFKITYILAIVTALMFFGILMVVTQILLSDIKFELSRDFEKIESDFQQDQKLSFNYLETSCYLLKNNSLVYEYIENETVNLNNNKIDNITEFLHSDIFIIFNKNNKVVFNQSPTNYGYNKSKALQYFNKLDTAKLWSGYKRIDNSLFRVATLPLKKNNKFYGLILLGFKSSLNKFAQFLPNSNIDITIFHEYRFMTSTTLNSITDSVRNEFSYFANEHRPVFDAVFSTQLNSGLFSTQLNLQEILAFIFPAGKGSPVFLMATIPKSIAFQQIQKIQKNIIIGTAIGMIMIIILGLVIDRKFTKRIAGYECFNISMVNAVPDFKGGMAIICTDISGLFNHNMAISTDDFINKNSKYLQLQNEIFELYEGTLNQFLGDKIVALFKGKDGIERAIECAVTLQKIVKKEFCSEKGKVGIGINYGQIVNNNINIEPEKEKLFDGPAVNLCASFSALARPGQILIRKDLMENINMNFKTGETQVLPLSELSEETEFVEILFDQRIISQD